MPSLLSTPPSLTLIFLLCFLLSWTFPASFTGSLLPIWGFIMSIFLTVCPGRHPLPQVQITLIDKVVPNLSLETHTLLFRHISLTILIFHLDVTQSCQFKCLKSRSLCFFYPSFLLFLEVRVWVNGATMWPFTARNLGTLFPITSTIQVIKSCPFYLLSIYWLHLFLCIFVASVLV